MKLKNVISVALLLTSVQGLAQSADPVLMRIGGKPVARSEFEYSYNKNNSQDVVDKKSVNDYVDLFVNYKLKVRAAEDAHLDTLASFAQEFATYRDMAVRASFITDADVEQKAHAMYDEARHYVDSLGGMVSAAHILIAVRQADSNAIDAKAKAKADSIYNVLKAGNFNESLFADLAMRHSDDRGTQEKGGQLPWLTRGQTVPAFDEKVYSMKVGDTSAPVRTAAGYHIIQLRDKKTYMEYHEVRDNIMAYIEQNNVKDQLINQKLNVLAAAKGNGATPEMVVAEREKELVATDFEAKYLIQEYHDGLLLYEISNRNIWEMASKDEAALEKFYKKNKKKYVWDSPRFKGIAYRTRDVADVENVKAALKGVAFDDWNETLRSTFNNDSVLRIRAEKGVFKKGDNEIVDKCEFKTGTEVIPMVGYDNVATYGKMLKKPETYRDVKRLVITDYQDELEKIWVAELRKKYNVEVDKAVLATVNKHNE